MVATTRAQSSADKWWTGYGNGPDNSRYFASRQINKSNVNQLQVAWTYPHGDTSGNPLVVRGVIYGRGRNGSIVAVDAKTGKELWVRENMNGMTNRGLMYWESRDGRDQRLIFAMNDLLQELDAKTGKSIMSFGTNGVVDLRVGIDGRDPATMTNIASRTPGEVFENLVILGAFTGEDYMSPPGDIRAYDVLTGKLVWTFHTVPRPGEFGYDTWPKDAWKYVGGTNTWGELTVDTERGIAYFPTGSPTYDYYGADRIGANLFGTSLVALDARTGKRLWHFQMVHHDLWDFDGNAAPQLTTIRHNGRNRDIVALAGKTGWLYVFDRVTGEPIWPIEERPVPKSDMPGEQTWPTQPFPTNPPPFAKQELTVEDVNPYLPPERVRAVEAARPRRQQQGIVYADQFHRDGAHPWREWRCALRRHGGGASHRRCVRDHAGQPGPPPLAPARREARGGGPPTMPGQAVYMQHCQVCHGGDRLGTDAGVPLIHAAADPAQQHRGRRSRASTRPRSGQSCRPGRTACPPSRHLSDQRRRSSRAVSDGAAGRTRARRRCRRPLRRSRTIRRATGAHRRIGIGVDETASTGPRRTRRASAVSRRRAADGALRHQHVRNDRQRHEAAVHDHRQIRPERADRSSGASASATIPTLVERGVTGTGVTQMRNSIIVTESGLVFGAGRDNQIRAWDSDTGKQLWSSRFGGNFVGSPAMYEMDGRQYLLVPAASTAGGRGGGAGVPAAPAGGPQVADRPRPRRWAGSPTPCRSN